MRAVMTGDILAATWNVEHGGKPATVANILRRELAAGVTIFALQEINAATLAVFRAAGLEVTRTPKASNAVAWTKTWTRKSRHDRVLAPDYRDGTGKRARTVHTHSPQVLLERADGVTVDVLSFHTPSRVQRPKPSPARMRVLKAAIATLSRLGRATKADVFLAAGDGNVHLTMAQKWDFLRDKATGLTRLAPPKGTHRGGRGIDVFFVDGARRVGAWVADGGGDHKLHRVRLRPNPKPVKEPLMKSQNGWTAYSDGRHPDLVAIPHVAGRVRRGDVATLFTYLIERFDREVEDVDEGRAQVNDDWGWAGRPIRGKTTGLSNHSSGTAIDLNATQHPLGRRGTFSPAQERGIEAILDDLDGCIRWGGNYSGRPDEMHFEINADAPKVAATAKRIKADKPKPRPNPQEDDMPYTNWPKKDRDALVADIKEAVIQHVLEPMPDAPKGRYVGATIAGTYRKVVGLQSAFDRLEEAIENGARRGIANAKEK